MTTVKQDQSKQEEPAAMKNTMPRVAISIVWKSHEADGWSLSARFTIQQGRERRTNVVVHVDYATLTQVDHASPLSR